MTPAELRQFARLGAEARLGELEQERAAIFRAFPSLRGPAHAANAAVFRDADANVERPLRRKRPKMSPEARERIAAAQRKRWAAWKAQKGTAGNGAATAAVQARAPKKR